jgi:hypothetical protein
MAIESLIALNIFVLFLAALTYFGTREDKSKGKRPPTDSAR